MSLGKYLYWKNIHLVENADIMLCQKSLEKRLEREREVIEFKDKKWWWLTWWWERCARTRLSRSCRPVPATKPGLLWSNSKCSEPPICEGSRETNPREGWRGSSFRCCCNETENLRDNFTTLKLYNFTDMTYRLYHLYHHHYHHNLYNSHIATTNNHHQDVHLKSWSKSFQSWDSCLNVAALF